MKYTERVLRAAIRDINDNLELYKCSLRLEYGGRNGYQAVDEYSVYPDGTRNGSGVNRNICCGTPRECGNAAWEWYYKQKVDIRKSV